MADLAVRNPPASATAPERGRLPFVDVLRVAVIALVIAHHAAQAYGPTGGAWPVTDAAAQSAWFVPFMTVNAAVGMGLLFLLAGYFVPRSYDRWGAAEFLRRRWLRIGVPMIVFAVFVHLPVTYVVAGQSSLGAYARLLWDTDLQGVYLHLWFLAHLLLYSLAYVGLRSLPVRTGRHRRPWGPPGFGAILAYVVLLAAMSWAVRLEFAIDEWVPLLFFTAEPAHLPQYISLFALGVVAYRGDWFRRLPTRVGLAWLGIGLAGAAVAYVVQGLWLDQWIAVMWGNGEGLRTLPYPLWESATGVGLCIGVIVALREVVRRGTPLLESLARDSYAAYLLHLWVVIGLQLVLMGVVLPAAAKFTVVTVGGTALTFGLAHASRGVPGLRVLLGTR